VGYRFRKKEVRPSSEMKAKLERIAQYWRELALMAEWRAKE
jgi:hypothetical protein